MIRPSALSGPGRCTSRYGGLRPGPIHGGRIDGGTAGIEGVDVARREIGRIAAHRGQDVVAIDRRRHGPRGIDDEIRHLGAEDRRLPVRPAHLHARAPDDFAAAQVIELKSRDVDDQELALGVVEHPPSALEIRAQLLDARRDRHVERRERRRADGAVGREPVARLKLTDGRRRASRRTDVPVDGGRGRQLARDGETRSERRHALVGAARLQRCAGRHGGPTAVRLDRPILGERVLETLVEKHARNRSRRELAQRRRIDGFLDRDGRIFAEQLARRIPVRIERVRIDLAEPQVITEPDDAVGQQDVELGAVARRQGGEIRQRAAGGPQRLPRGSRSDRALRDSSRR